MWRIFGSVVGQFIDKDNTVGLPGNIEGLCNLWYSIWSSDHWLFPFLHVHMLRSRCWEENWLTQGWGFIVDQYIKKTKSCEGRVLILMIIMSSPLRGERGTIVNKSIAHFYNFWRNSSHIVYNEKKREFKVWAPEKIWTFEKSHPAPYL